MKYNKGDFTLVPNKEVRRGLSPNQQTLYLWLCEYSDKEGRSFPSRKRLSEDCGMSLRSIDNAIKDLVEFGLINKEQRYKDSEKISSIYTVNILEGGSARGAVPSAGDAVPTARGAHRTIPTKPNPLNNTITNVIETSTEVVSYGNSDVNKVMDCFETNFGMKPPRLQSNRQSAYRLIRKLKDADKVCRIVEYSASIQGKPYSPTVGSIMDIENKLIKLIAHSKQVSEQERIYDAG